MKAINLDILKLAESKPGLSINKIGTSLCGKWCSSYIRTQATELLAQGYLQNITDGSGRCRFSLHITDAGRDLIQSWQAVKSE